MKIRRLDPSLILVCCIITTLSSYDFNNIPTVTQPPKRILFIGNSYTYVNKGIDQELKDMVPSAEVSRIVAGGYKLRDHWNSGQALKAIRESQWDFVVLQEQSQTPVCDRASFCEFAGKFDAEIKKAGAKTILLMTWERPDSVTYGVTTSNLTNVFHSLGAQLGAAVTPAGIAFAKSLKARPDLILNSDDGHPTVYGTYLAACVLYGTIYSASPFGNPPSDSAITEGKRLYFHHVAAEALGIVPVERRVGSNPVQHRPIS